MALIKCSECKKDVSTTATVCPHCGAPVAEFSKKKPMTTGSSIGVAIIVIVFVMFLISMCSSSNDSKPTTDVTAEKSCANTDLQCRGEKAVVAAGIYCKDPIEHMAKHSVRWTDGTFEMKFSRFRWASKPGGNLTMIGDKAEFQNGFGAYTPVIYQCDLGPDDKTVLDVRVEEGRLP